MAEPTTLLLHEDAHFENQVVYITGHAFKRCSFERCTFVFQGAPYVFSECSFGGVVWHFDLVIHDEIQLNVTLETLNVVRGALPKVGGPPSSPQDNGAGEAVAE